MGHIRLGTLPKARKWNQVVSLIDGGADAERRSSDLQKAASAAARRACGPALPPQRGGRLILSD